MKTRIDISIGPVQGFVAQSRRTRDLWGSSYLLSFLSAHAMRAASNAGAMIIQPVVDQDPLFRWVSGHRNGGPPRIGSVPNHFAVETEGDPGLVADAATDALERAWQRVSNAVWKRYAEHALPFGIETDRIWNRQVVGFWDVIWTAGPIESGSGLLARRKHWRSHRLPDEPGDKCTVMTDLQELSGYVRAESLENRENQDRFWNRVRGLSGTLDLREDERLCAVAFVKRLFPKVSDEALGWKTDSSHWPSTVYLGAVPWMQRVESTVPQQAAAYAKRLKQYADDEVFPMRRPPFGLGTPDAGEFARLDANYLHRHWVEDQRRCPLRESAEDGARKELSGALADIYRTDAAGRRLGLPGSFYALLLADGDRLGTLVGELGGKEVGKSLAGFTADVARTVNEHDGVTVYAGGDDVLAMLALPNVMSCAAALSQSYRSAFNGRPGATLSVAVAFAHVRYPLSSVLAAAHRLLDDVAKDDNGRDSLAAGVLKPSGPYCQWTTTWNRTCRDGGSSSSAIGLLDKLVQQLSLDAAEPGLSSALIYRIRDLLAFLCGWNRWEPGAWGTLADDLDVRAFLHAAIVQSLGARMAKGAESRADEMTELVWELLRRSRAPSDHGKIEPAEVGIDALLLARFLAASGHDERDR